MFRRRLIIAFAVVVMACDEHRPNDPEWLLRSGSRDEKREFLERLGHSEEPGNARVFARFLQDPDPEIVAKAAFFIGHLKARDFIPQLRTLLRNEDDRVVNMAAAGLREMIDGRDVGLASDFERLLTHRYLLARIGGIEGLGRIQSAASTALLVDRLEHDEPAAKYYAAISLGQVKDVAALPALERALDEVKRLDHSSPRKGRARGMPPHPDLMQDALENAIANMRP